MLLLFCLLVYFGGNCEIRELSFWMHVGASLKLDLRPMFSSQTAGANFALVQQYKRESKGLRCWDCFDSPKRFWNYFKDPEHLNITCEKCIFLRAKCGNSQHRQPSREEPYCSFLFWQRVRPYYCNRSQESLIHRVLSGKEKLLEQSSFWEPVVKSSDQSTLSSWASWGLGTQTSVLQWPRCTEEPEDRRVGVRGRCGQTEGERQRFSDSQAWWEKTSSFTNTGSTLVCSQSWAAALAGLGVSVD